VDDPLATGQGRANVLARVRRALGRSGPDAQSIAAAGEHIARHVQGPRPAPPPDLAARFAIRAQDMASTLERIASREEIPLAIQRYLDAMKLEGAQRAGVCWPEFADLDWTAAGLSLENRPATGDDKVGVTSAQYAIAETGTLAILSGAATPTGAAILPDTHIAVVQSACIVAGMEDMFGLVRRRYPRLPRAINMISGPSRTGDIEQTIVLGAHGPVRVHILLLP